MKSLAIELLLLLASTMILAQTNPVPFVSQPLVPTATAPGGPSFTLTVNGTGFTTGSVIKWDGTALGTSFVNSSQLRATVPAPNISTASTASITVSSPAPGGGTSNVVFFEVSEPTTVQFTSFPDPINGILPVSLPPIVADFNGDGKLDFTLNECPGDSCASLVFLGNGTGTFQLLDYLAGGGDWVAEGDFNADGKPDLAITSCGPPGICNLLLLLGNGDGTFSGNSGAPPTLPYASVQFVIGDFNRDGKLDVAVAAATGGIYVFLGNGDGTFQTALISNVGSFGLLGVGDFNKDGKLDLVGMSGSQISFLQGNGDGTFQAPATSYSVGTNTGRMIAADLNGDDKLDLIAIQYYTTNTLTILLGNGDGTFKVGSPTSIGTRLSGGAIGDLNADGKLDLILSDYTDTLVLPGNGDGTFQNPITIPQPESADTTLDAAVGDFNNDGKLDLVLAPSGYLIQEVPLANPSPTSLKFPAQLAGTKSATQTVTLNNAGSATLTVTSIGITGANASDFGQTNTCASTIAIGASCSINVTFTPTAGEARSAMLTVSTNGIGGPLTVALAGTGQDFSLTSDSSTSATVSPGQTASYGLMANPQGGFNQTVQLSCSGAPAQSTCSVLPNSLKLSGSLTAVVAVSTASTARLRQPTVLPPYDSTFLPWATLLIVFWPAMLAGRAELRCKPCSRQVALGVALLLLLSVGVMMTGCGGGNGGSKGTPSGSYTLTVTGTFTSGSDTLTHATRFTLIVQ